MLWGEWNMRHEDLNIMSNIKIIEELKANLLCVIGDFFLLLTRGSNIARDSILDCVSGAIIILYVLAERLGYSYTSVDEKIEEKLQEGIKNNDIIEKDGKDLSRLDSYLNERSSNEGSFTERR